VTIVLEGIRRSFGSKVVLDGIDLEVHDGETLAVIGGSGVGKSVLLKTIVRLIEPQEGRVEVDGEDVGTLTKTALYLLRQRVGYVFQFAALFDSMTVFDNVAMGLRRAGTMSREEIRDRVTESLKLVEMSGFEDRLPAELSGGQRKRVGLARAIATRPKYLLYDEPTSGLDPVTTSVIDEMITRMARELGVTSVVVTHDMQSAYKVANRIAMLHDGRIQFDGTPDEIRQSVDPVVRAFVEGRHDLAQETA
jgi:phospholipid/cholesterol/gamma-HCH transport system ATP-binding protein